MKISRAAGASMRPKFTRLPWYSVKPYSVPRSSAITSPAFFSQCGSLKLVFSRCPHCASTHCGSMLARPRPHRRVVSTNSDATTQRPGFLARCAPGQGQNLMPRAPR
jgi:hypothetical protein